MSNEDLHIQYGFGDRMVSVVNSLYKARSGPLVASAQVLSLEGKSLYSHTQQIDNVPSDGVVDSFRIPTGITGLTKTYFLRLVLTDGHSQQVLSTNVYWLSTASDVLDYSKSTFYNTPCTSFADFKLLQTLPKVISIEIN